jgi:hypothetical protein
MSDQGPFSWKIKIMLMNWPRGKKITYVPNATESQFQPQDTRKSGREGTKQIQPFVKI